MSEKGSLLQTAFVAMLSVLVGAGATYYFDQLRRGELAAEAAERLFLSKMTIYLDATEDAFRNQVRERDRFVVLLERNHSPLPQLEYEALCREMHDRLSEEEQYVFQKIRGLTTTLYEYNAKMRREIEDNPDVYATIPRLRDLHEHLSLWISKYDSVFSDDPRACLVYVGVEEGKPFPPGIDADIAEALRRHDG